MKVAVSVQVRMGSGRLPGKPMMEFSGKPMLWHLINRIRQSNYIDEISVAIPVTDENNIIERFCDREEIPCFRGPEDDVLGRTLGSLRARGAEIGVVVFVDNPLVDPVIIDEHIELFQSDVDYDWVGNDLTTTFPPGMEIEVFKVDALCDSSRRTSDPDIREHATLFIRQHPSIYHLLNVEAKGVRRRPDLYLGVDTPVDAEVLHVIIEHFNNMPYFSLEEIISFMDKHPEVAYKNRSVPRRWWKYRDQ